MRVIWQVMVIAETGRIPAEQVERTLLEILKRHAPDGWEVETASARELGDYQGEPQGFEPTT